MQNQHYLAILPSSFPKRRILKRPNIFEAYLLVIIFSFIVYSVMGHNDLTSILRQSAYYNRDDVPTATSGTATIVSIQMYIEGMSSFRAQTMDFSLDIYFQEKWLDERLAHNGSKRILVKDPNLFNLIWHPDLYFANARTAEFHHVTSPNFLVWIYPNDAYDLEQLVIDWNVGDPAQPSGAIQTNPEILMPDMRLRNIIPRLRNDTYATGVWSCATAEFIVDHVESVPGRVSLSITTLLTLATQNSAERLTLPQSSYVKAMIEFTLVNYCTRRKHSSERLTSRINHGEDKSAYEAHSSPYNKKMLLEEQVSDIHHNAADGTNFNRGAAFRGIKVGKDNEDRNSDQPVTFHKIPSFSSFSNKNASSRKKKMEERLQRVEQNRKEAQSIDRKCRIYFPLAFLLFNICYWSYYMIFATDEM